MEWIKSFYIEKYTIYEKNLKKFKIQSSNVFCFPLSHVLRLFEHNFCSYALIGKKKVSHEAN